jgi:hypothetical protein
MPETPDALGLYAIPEIILFSLAIPGDFNTYMTFWYQPKY